MREFFENQGYSHVRKINGKWYGITRMIYTTAVWCDLDDFGNRAGRLCFHGVQDAIRFLATWDGVSDPTPADGLVADKRIKRATECTAMIQKDTLKKY